MASVLDAIREGVAEVFVELASVAQTVTYHVVGSPTYDAATGAVTIPTTDATVAGFVFDFKHREIDGLVVRVGDKKLLLERAAAEAAASGFGPRLEDRVTIGSVVHDVISWIEDPARATVELHLRRSV